MRYRQVSYAFKAIVPCPEDPVVDNTRHHGVRTLEGEVKVLVDKFQKARLHVQYWQALELDPSVFAEFEIQSED